MSYNIYKENNFYTIKTNSLKIIIVIKHLFKCSDIDDEEVITVSSDLFFYMMKNYSPKVSFILT